MLNCCIAILFKQFTKTLNQFFYLSGAKKNLEDHIPVRFEQQKE